MEIINKSETELKVVLKQTNYRLLRHLLIFSVLSWPIFAIARMITLDGSIFEIVLIILRVVSFLGMVLAFLFVVLFLNESIDSPVEQFEIDTELGEMTLTKRVIWRFWSEQIEKQEVDQFKAIVLGQSDKSTVVGISLKDGQELRLGAKIGGGKIIEIAEALSQFLRVPIEIVMGAERISRYPLELTKQVAVNCSKCGGQFDQIVENTRQIKCEYCNTLFRLTWTNSELMLKSKQA